MKIDYKLIIISVALHCVPVGIFPEDVNASGETRDPAWAVERIASDHERIRSRILDARASSNAAKSAGRIYPDPEIMIMRMSGRMEEQTLYPDPMLQRNDTTGYEYRITQPIPAPGKLTAESRVARAESKIRNLELGIERNTIVSEFLEDLIDARRLLAIRTLTADFEKRLGVLSDVSRARYASGGGTLADASRAALFRDRYSEMLLSYQAEVETLRSRLRYYGDYEPEPFTEESLSRYFEGLIRGLAGEGIENRSIEIALLSELESKRGSELTRQRFEYLPDFSLFAGVRSESGGGDLLSVMRVDQRSYLVGVTIRLPIWSSLSNASKTDEKRDDTQSALYKKRDAVRRLAALFDEARFGYESGKKRYELTVTRLIPEAQAALNSTRLAYEANRADFSSLLDGYLDLYDQEMRGIELRAQTRKSAIRMASLTNSLLQRGEEANVNE
jgi:outer membrane protein TolC